MKTILSLLSLILVSSVSLAKTAQECKQDIAKTQSSISEDNQRALLQIIKSKSNSDQMKSEAAEILKTESCAVAIMQSNDGGSIEGLASALVNEMTALPPEMQTPETVDKVIGYILLEN